MPRNSSRTQVSLEVLLDFTSGRREARISDLSLSGCFVDSIVNVSEGETLSVTFRAAGEDWLTLRGEAIYIFPGIGFGVRFLDLTENQKKLLEHIIVTNGGDPWKRDVVDY